MVESYEILRKKDAFTGDVIGIYQIKDDIVVLYVDLYHVTKDSSQGKEVNNCILLDRFSADFKKHHRGSLDMPGFVIADDCDLYEENGKFILNTKKYKGFIESTARLLEIKDKGFMDLGKAPEPVANIYNDSKIYKFGNVEVYMHSPFIMACREWVSGKILWKTKIGSYLYTEVTEEEGVIYFGTAGNGGKFVAVDLTTGNIVYSYKTKGTVNFIFYQDYVLLADKKYKSVLLKRKDGSMFREIEFDNFNLTVDQHMIIYKDSLYAISNKKGEQKLYVVKADLYDNPNYLPETDPMLLAAVETYKNHK